MNNDKLYLKFLEFKRIFFLEKDFLLFWTPMTHIVTENCIKCKYTDCVEVCPVDCFKEGENFLVIDPKECIDCSICIPECPVDAINYDQELKEREKIFLKINFQFSKIWKVINKVKKNNNEKWIKLKNKIHLIKI